MAQREELVGREEELGSIGAFLDGACVQPSALALEGEAGVGNGPWTFHGRRALDTASVGTAR